MEELHAHQRYLLDCISLELKEQEKRYALKGENDLKQLKSLGIALHPITVNRKSFGYADYPEISFRLPFSSDTSSFKDNSAIECFIDGEDAVKGVLLNIDGQKGTFRLYAPDFPDWIEEKGVGLKLSADQQTFDSMKNAVKAISEKGPVRNLFLKIHGDEAFSSSTGNVENIVFENKQLNESQQSAVISMVNNEELSIVHGPPGTGKTTTLIEGITQLIKEGKRIAVTAPSNAAVDNIAKGLVASGAKVLRVGNTLKVDESVKPFTLEGKLKEAKEHKEIAKLKKKAEELRRMSYQYKRNFGREEREQRSLLIREVKNIRKEIRNLRNYFNDKLYDNAEVILGTPIGLHNFLSDEKRFDVLVMDEAGQCIEPLGWVVFPYADKWILAGDPFQLPPTVISDDARQKGLNSSILERSFKSSEDVYFLDTQYRMRGSIAGFSNEYFYEGKLITPTAQNDIESHVVFYDTAGTGYEEEQGKDGSSLMNSGELSVIQKILERDGEEFGPLAIISPYAGQVQLLKNELPEIKRVSTVDSFQGQESDTVIISLVRSNSDGVIGFLKDYRRMNVAMTRAKERLIVIGDSATIGLDPFFAKFLNYVEELEGYRSAWELIG